MTPTMRRAVAEVCRNARGHACRHQAFRAALSIEDDENFSELWAWSRASEWQKAAIEYVQDHRTTQPQAGWHLSAV
jgi:hypothetical protein